MVFHEKAPVTAAFARFTVENPMWTAAVFHSFHIWIQGRFSLVQRWVIHGDLTVFLGLSTTISTTGEEEKHRGRKNPPLRRIEVRNNKTEKRGNDHG